MSSIDTATWTMFDALSRSPSESTCSWLQPMHICCSLEHCFNVGSASHALRRWIWSTVLYQLNVRQSQATESCINLPRLTNNHNFSLLDMSAFAACRRISHFLVACPRLNRTGFQGGRSSSRWSRKRSQRMTQNATPGVGTVGYSPFDHTIQVPKTNIN